MTAEQTIEFSESIIKSEQVRRIINEFEIEPPDLKDFAEMHELVSQGIPLTKSIDILPMEVLAKTAKLPTKKGLLGVPTQ